MKHNSYAELFSGLIRAIERAEDECDVYGVNESYDDLFDAVKQFVNDSKVVRSVPQEFLNEAWAQADELNEDFEGLSDEVIIDLRECIHERVRIIMACLHDYVPEDMSEWIAE
tara:strand:- start:104 stop:442 length:339 start_codon:yes stop_codon:yes gene_type:complete